MLLKHHLDNIIHQGKLLMQKYDSYYPPANLQKARMFREYLKKACYTIRYFYEMQKLAVTQKNWLRFPPSANVVLYRILTDDIKQPLFLDYKVKDFICKKFPYALINMDFIKQLEDMFTFMRERGFKEKILIGYSPVSATELFGIQQFRSGEAVLIDAPPQENEKYTDILRSYIEFDKKFKDIHLFQISQRHLIIFKHRISRPEDFKRLIDLAKQEIPMAY